MGTAEVLTSPEVAAKERRLSEILRELESVVVGFSGGVDSAYLAYMANRVLGDKALCVTAVSPSYPAFQRKETIEFVSRFHLRHLEIRTNEVDDSRYRENSTERCYFCKSELFSKLQGLAREKGFRAVVDGTNRDDRSDFRPGRACRRAISGSQSAFGCRNEESRDPRALPAGRSAYLEQTCLTLSLFPISLRHFHYPGEAIAGGTRRRDPAALRVQDFSGCDITKHWSDWSSPRKNCPRLWTWRWPPF